jgi:hypothetical protein
MLQIENTFFDLAAATDGNRNVLVICDRGAMDASAFISREQWENILGRCNHDEVEIRDNRYNQVTMSDILTHVRRRAPTKSEQLFIIKALNDPLAFLQEVVLLVRWCTW